MDSKDMCYIEIPMNETRWILAQESEEARALSSKLGIPLPLAQALVNRNIRDVQSAQKFMFGTLEDLHDPFLMNGMREAVERIKRAAVQREKVLIIGDYDVDGILSIVILTKALRALGIDVDFYIPDRLKEGYGIKEKHVEVALEKGASLVISVDCGIKSVQFAREAKKQKIDFIVTDHHLPDSSLPEAVAVLNPLISACGYPDKNLAGIGVVFKMIQALFAGSSLSSTLPHYLKLVSIGTVADVAVLEGENRLFVKYGLEGLADVSNIGLQQLLETCGLGSGKVSTGDVGFRIGPRINAAGRMGKTELAVRLFFSDSLMEVKEIVKDLEKLNSQRQKVEEEIFEQAMHKIKKKFLDQRYKFLILGSDKWHRGVIGIVASRLKEAFHRPVILFAYEDGKALGSGRSISGFSLIECLDENRDIFHKYGGHTQAIGCELPLESIEELKKAINSYAAARLSEEDLKRKISIDARLELDQITFPFLEGLSSLSPFGVGNPRPVFLSEGAEVAGDPWKLKGKHLKTLVRQNGRVFEALGWGRGDWAESLQKGSRIDLVYTFQFSEYMGEEKLSLALEDLKKA